MKKVNKPQRMQIYFSHDGKPCSAHIDVYNFRSLNQGVVNQIADKINLIKKKLSAKKLKNKKKKTKTKNENKNK
jgi:hypothetical protein